MSSTTTTKRQPFLLVPSPPSSSSSKSRSVSPTSCDDTLVLKKSGSRGQRIRASKPKVKSGCITCKFRRVKCDEQKPGCNRCKKLGKECGGYAKEASTVHSTVLLPLKPKPLIVNLSLARSGVTDGESWHNDSCGMADVSVSPAASQHQFWGQLILQECYSEPKIRCAVSSMAKVAKFRRLEQTDTVDYATPFFTSFEIHESFLDDFRLAVVHLGRSLADGRLATTQTALVTCLLLVAFENLCGDPDKIEEHIQGGLALLEQWFLEHPQSSSDVISIPKHPEDLIVDDLSAIISPLEDSFHGMTTWTSAIQSFPSVLHDNAIDESHLIPLAFDHLDQASLYWHQLLRRLRDFDCNSKPLRCFSAEHYPLPWSEEERKTNLNLLFLFRTALEPLLRLSHKATDFPLDARPLLLDLAAQTSQLYLTVTDASELPWDLSSHIFADLMTRSQSIMDHIQHPTITLEPATDASTTSHSLLKHLLPALHITALKCRDPKVRRHAIALLFSYPRPGFDDPTEASDTDIPHHEGGLAIMLGTVDLWIMALEESGVNELGFIPETARWRLVDVECDLTQRWVWAKACRDGRDDFGHWFAGVATEEARLTW